MRNTLLGIGVSAALIGIICYAPAPVPAPGKTAVKPAASRPVPKPDAKAAPTAPVQAIAPVRLDAPKSTPSPSSLFDMFDDIPVATPLSESVASAAPIDSRGDDARNYSTAGVLPAMAVRVGVVELPDSGLDFSAMAGPKLPAETNSHVAVIKIPYSAVNDIPPVNREKAVSSSTSYANLVSDAPANACPTSVCTDPPPKGITVRGYGRIYREKESSAWSDGLNTDYRTDGKLGGIGFLKDWSVATTLGLSAEYLSAGVDSDWSGGSRTNDVTGYLFNAHIKSSFMDKFPVDAKLIYGVLDTKGNGGWTDGERWNESTRRSKMFGFSGKLGVPLVFGDDIKLEPDIGLQFLRLQTDPYDMIYNDGEIYTIDSVNSTSFTVPIMVGMKKEMKQCFGTFTPRLWVGFIKEFSDTAMGVRTFNIASSSFGGASRTDANLNKFYQIGAGFDLATLGGWGVRADYAYTWVNKYKNNSFSLEASRCF